MRAVSAQRGRGAGGELGGGEVAAGVPAVGTGAPCAGAQRVHRGQLVVAGVVGRGPGVVERVEDLGDLAVAVGGVDGLVAVGVGDRGGAGGGAFARRVRERPGVRGGGGDTGEGGDAVLGVVAELRHPSLGCRDLADAAGGVVGVGGGGAVDVGDGQFGGAGGYGAGRDVGQGAAGVVGRRLVLGVGAAGQGDPPARTAVGCLEAGDQAGRHGLRDGDLVAVAVGDGGEVPGRVVGVLRPGLGVRQGVGAVAVLDQFGVVALRVGVGAVAVLGEDHVLAAGAVGGYPLGAGEVEGAVVVGVPAVRHGAGGHGEGGGGAGQLQALADRVEVQVGGVQDEVAGGVVRAGHQGVVQAYGAVLLPGDVALVVGYRGVVDVDGRVGGQPLELQLVGFVVRLEEEGDGAVTVVGDGLGDVEVEVGRVGAAGSAGAADGGVGGLPELCGLAVPGGRGGDVVDVDLVDLIGGAGQVGGVDLLGVQGGAVDVRAGHAGDVELVVGPLDPVGEDQPW